MLGEVLVRHIAFGLALVGRNVQLGHPPLGLGQGDLLLVRVAAIEGVNLLLGGVQHILVDYPQLRLVLLLLLEIVLQGFRLPLLPVGLTAHCRTPVPSLDGCWVRFPR